MLGDHFASPVFTAALELWVAARTDAALLAAVAPLEQRVGRETHRLTVELLGVDESRPGVRELVQATLDLVRGLGLANTITDDARRRRRILDQLGAHARRRRSGSAHDDLLDDRARRPRRPRATGSRRWSPTSTRTAGGRRRRPPGWDVATQIAHLRVDRRGRASRPPTDKEAWDASCCRRIADPDGFVDAGRSSGAAAAPAELLARWRGRARGPAPRRCASCPTGQKMPWFGPPMSPTSMATARFMETWAHALDVHEALGRRAEPTDRMRHVAHLGVRTRDFAFRVHELDAAGRGVPGRADRAVAASVWPGGPRTPRRR